MDFNGKKVGCLVTQPQPADDKGEFNRKKRLEIWFSDDEDKLPMRIKAKIAIGSIVADLIYAGRPKAEKRAAASAPVPKDTAKKTDTLKPLPTQKAGDTLKTFREAAVKKEPSGTAVGGAAAPAADTLRADTVQAGPDETVATDTAKAPGPPVSKTSYETIEVKDAGGKPETAPSGTGGKPEHSGCSRDNSY